MSTGVSIFLIGVGAILTFALEREADGINLNTVGIILMVVGVIGLVFSALFWNTWSPYGPYARRRRVVEVELGRRGSCHRPCASYDTDRIARRCLTATHDHLRRARHRPGDAGQPRGP
jgi:hypothetical protein